MFSVCQFTRGGGGGITPVSGCGSFPGSTFSLWPQVLFGECIPVSGPESFPGGTPAQYLGGTPRIEVSTGQNRGTPSLHCKVSGRMCGVGGMLLAFIQEDFFVPFVFMALI